VAVTVTVVLLETTGAVNRPVLDTVPAVALQVTAGLFVLTVIAVKCCVPPEMIVLDAGETATETGGGAGD